MSEKLTRFALICLCVLPVWVILRRPWKRPLRREVALCGKQTKLLIRKLTMSVAGGMKHTGASIGHMGNNAGQLQIVHKLDGIFACTLQTESNHTA